MSKTRVFMLVSEDELELPLCVEDSVELLARRVGTSKNCISSTMTKTNDLVSFLDGDEGQYTKADFNMIRQALRKARQARFEHGERG